jgi:uncharacterized membrane protein YfcA
VQDPSPAQIALLLVASAAGGVIQGALGFGFALVAVPALALADPDSVPVVVMLMATPMTAIMAVRERHAIDVRGLVTIMVGRTIGIGLGAALLIIIPADSLAVLIGTMILLGVALSVAGLDIEPRRWVNLGAGIVSGVMGTTSAIGGPALAVVYQRRPGPELRSTLAVSYLAGLFLALAVLTAIGRVEGWHVVAAAQLTPGLLLGLWLSGRIARALDGGWLRPAVLSVAAVAGVVIVLRPLV